MSEGEKKQPALTEFLLKLAANPAEVEKLWRDELSAGEMMKAAGINAEQREAILSRDERRIQNAVVEELDSDIFPRVYPWIVRQHAFGMPTPKK